ncbi:FAD-dependent monooxygenase [Thalassospira sp.]|uniref:FAD-dependent monooxygenase n=1 Tax=Thalassospira sp. TaxID=1912094 RepID=UPI002737040E|nr:FAD-dependent monooxygenase [Thalassospira sp.]MDP2697050.1 FAD-dependent monooxygenase [Thalassospira sp.]
MITTDILIAGGGIAGMSAAARLAADGHEIILVDPAPASPDHNAANHPDLRTTAFLQPGIATLTRAGAWQAMQDNGAMLRVMRIIDAGGAERTPRQTADFDGIETGHGHFGWNITNRTARTALLARLAGLPNVQFLQGVAVTGMAPGTDTATVTLSDQQTIATRLVIAADGRDSALRDMAGITHRRWQYDQSALVFAVTHDRPHDNISTEIHRTGGPLTLVPMPDHNGKPCSSVVWMTPARRADTLFAMDDATLSQTLMDETMGLFGTLAVTGGRAVWPMISQIAARLTGPRLALIAEAAHVVPPIGAQGLNMSLHDIETLAGLLATARNDGDDIGAARLLTRYHRRNFPRMVARVGGIDILNRAAMAEPRPLRDLRCLGLTALNKIAPLRKLAIRAGIGE